MSEESTTIITAIEHLALKAYLESLLAVLHSRIEALEGQVKGFIETAKSNAN